VQFCTQSVKASEKKVMKSDKKNVNIIFDLDGTLVDSAQITIPAFKEVCPKLGFKIPGDETIMAAIGYANPIFYYKIFPDIDKAKVRELGDEVELTEKKIVSDINTGMLFDGIAELLADLTKRGYKLYVASTGGEEHVNTCLKVCNIYAFFEKIYCNKPDKELMVADIIKDAPGDIWIMIGDRRKDSKAAKYNKITGVGAAYGYCNVEDYHEFDYVVNKPKALLDIISNLI